MGEIGTLVDFDCPSSKKRSNAQFSALSPSQRAVGFRFGLFKRRGPLRRVGAASDTPTSGCKMIRRLATKSSAVPLSICRRYKTHTTGRRSPTVSLGERCLAVGFRTGASADATSVTAALGMTGAILYLRHQERDDSLAECSASPQENVDLIKIADINKLYSLGEVLGEGMCCRRVCYARQSTNRIICRCQQVGSGKCTKHVAMKMALSWQ